MHKLTLNYVKQSFRDHNCELLENDYKDAHSLMAFKCACGKIAQITWANFSQGHRCRECGLKKIWEGRKTTIEEVHKIFQNGGCTLLATEYINSVTKMEYICECGRKAKINLNNFKNGRRCWCCRNEKVGDALRLTLEEAKKIFTDGGCTLLADSYISASTPMSYICSCGTKATMNLNNFQKGKRCNKCGKKRMAKSQTTPYTEVKQKFNAAGCELLIEENDYTRARGSVPYKCKCGRISRTPPYAFKGHCLVCATKRGENHPNWNPDREFVTLCRIIQKRYGNMVRQFLRLTNKKKDKRSHDILGYTRRELKQHLLSHPDWPKIKRSGQKWHIDHYFPIAAFVKHNILDPQIINHLDNLRPMTASENIAKRDHYDKQEFFEWLKTKGIKIHELQS